MQSHHRIQQHVMANRLTINVRNFMVMREDAIESVIKFVLAASSAGTECSLLYKYRLMRNDLHDNDRVVARVTKCLLIIYAKLCCG